MNLPATFGGPPPPLDEAVRAVLEAEGIQHGEISVTLLDDAAITELHDRYLGVEEPTDVLSFSLASDDEPVLGDVYIGHETAALQADALGVPAQEELVRLAVHGVLHILGYDHPDGDDRAESPMYQRQEALVRAFLMRMDTL